MSDAPENVRKRMTRCPEGHVFDAAANAACPTCAAAPAATGGEERPSPIKRDDHPPPAWLRLAAFVGAAIVVVLIVLVVLRGAPKSVTQSPAVAVAPSAPAKTASPQNLPPADTTQKPATTEAPAAATRWKTTMVIGGKSYLCINETHPDGRYRLGDGCPPPFAGETGVTTVKADGSWTSRSDAGRTDAGAIQFLDANRFIAHTRGGPVIWERAGPND